MATNMSITITPTPAELTDLIELPAEKRMEAVLAFTFHGIHHCDNIEKNPDFWRTKTSSLATFDFDGLTRLVIAAHAYGVRAQVSPCGPRDIRITLHPRKSRSGGFTERHPTILQAIESYCVK